MPRFVFLAVLCALAPASAAHAALPFDPDAATRAWLATLGPEATARSNAYFEGGYWIQILGAALGIGVSVLMLALGWARRVRDWLERSVKAKTLVAFGMGVFYIAVSSVLTFPFTWYVGFIREHQFGLSTQNFGQWFGEFAIGFAISLVLSALFIAILYLIVRAARNAWWVWGSAFAIFFFALANFAAPVLIAPLFNTYQPMQESPLKDDILAMAQANGVPADNVYVYDRSRQTNSISANVSGLFGTTRISIADTLISRASPDAVRAVLGHEIGHYVLGHTYSLMIMVAMLVLIFFAATHYIFRAIAKNGRWGIRDIDDPAGLPLALAIITALGLLATPAQNTLIRFHEQQADMFGLNAARAPDGFAEASVLLSEYRKMAPSPLEEFVFFDHPSGWTRIHNAMVWKAHEIAAGRLPPSPGGPPPNWRPDFVVLRDPAPSPHR